MNKNLYANTAFLYDFDNRDLLNEDIKLCLDLIKETHGDILEIACGTGRVTIPILENALDRKVTAFDLSDEMLSVFKSKIFPGDYADLELLKEDMTSFNLNQKFGLVILIWRAFQVLLTEEDAKKCLQSVRSHMAEDALFLFSVFLPQKSYGENWIGKENFSYEIIDSPSNNKIRRHTKNLKSDEEKQIIEYASVYNIFTPDGKNEILEDRIIYKYYYPEQIKKLLTSCGFDIIKEYSTSTDIFFTLKKV